MTAQPPSLAGRRLGGRYTLLTHIAQGGMGEVWKARDQQTGHLVAVKVLRNELSGQELSLSRLRIEAANAMRIHHPNVANVLDSGEDDGRGWIVMELVESRPLTAYLSGGRRLSAAHLLPILMQVAMALAAADKAGVVHRDIKPANILVRKDGVVKLTDFGISRTTDQVTLTGDGMVMGTAQYLPPEQAMGKEATTSGDLYALGVIAFEALAGKRPYTGSTQVDIAFAHVNEPLPPLPSDVDEAVAALVRRMLEKNPADRPASATALAREVAQVATKLGVDVAPHPLPLADGMVETARTAAQPVVPPVKHETRSRLPREMLQPVDMEKVLRGPLDGSSARTSPDQVKSPTAGQALADRRAATSSVSSSATLPSTTQASTGRATSPASPGFRQGASGRSVISGHDALERNASGKGTPGDHTTSGPGASGRSGASSRTTSDRVAARTAASPAQTAASSTRTSASPTRAAASPTRTSASPTRAAASSTRTSASPTRAAASPTGATPSEPTDPPLATKYNRSTVAKPEPTAQKIGKWTVISLFILTLILVVVATIQNRFGFSLLGSGVETVTIEEVKTWQSLWSVS
ncbi:serine/threonine protein kinase [Schaalia suimastitidis]|uniref:serine/threonine protein kinase n=1 Tax=Schaalia suimastitidis TaxID=121163 RepID=UPI0004061454|nr:serine/threonine-protein kinase [Schaalia suimastitidis]